MKTQHLYLSACFLLAPVLLPACGSGDDSQGGAMASGAMQEGGANSCAYGVQAAPAYGLTETDASACNSCASASCCAEITECNLTGASCDAVSVTSCFSSACAAECDGYIAVFDAAIEEDRRLAEQGTPEPVPEPPPVTSPPPAVVPDILNVWIGTVTAHALQTTTDDWGFWDGLPDLEVCLDVGGVEMECLSGTDDSLSSTLSKNFSTSIQSSDVLLGIVALVVYDDDGLDGRDKVATVPLALPDPYDAPIAYTSTTSYGLDQIDFAFY